jgi:O-methyltransferase
MNADNFAHHRLPDTPANRFRGKLLISDQVTPGGVGVVWRELERVLRSAIPGAIVEFGCYAGTTSVFIRRLLDEHNQSSQREFHVYDSFAGLPEKRSQDQSAAGVNFTAGKLHVSKKTFLQVFQAAHLQPPLIHKGWFDQLTSADVPEQIAFAFLDGDFYNSILVSLQLVWPRLSVGGTILIDDYQRDTLPGVERAVRDFFQYKKTPTIRVEQGIAILAT